MVEPGRYDVEVSGEMLLLEGRDRLHNYALRAVAQEHEEELRGPTAFLIEDEGGSERRLVLLQPGGGGVSAVGYAGGVRPRGGPGALPKARLKAGISYHSVSGLRVTSPGSKSHWSFGRQSIKWLRTGPQPSFVNIELYRKGKPYRKIASRVRNRGSFLWRVPQNLADGSCSILVTSRDRRLGDFSENFRCGSNPVLQMQTQTIQMQAVVAPTNQYASSVESLVLTQSTLNFGAHPGSATGENTLMVTLNAPAGPDGANVTIDPVPSLILPEVIRLEPGQTSAQALFRPNREFRFPADAEVEETYQGLVQETYQIRASFNNSSATVDLLLHSMIRNIRPHISFPHISELISIWSEAVLAGTPHRFTAWCRDSDDGTWQFDWRLWRSLSIAGPYYLTDTQSSEVHRVPPGDRGSGNASFVFPQPGWYKLIVTCSDGLDSDWQTWIVGVGYGQVPTATRKMPAEEVQLSVGASWSFTVTGEDPDANDDLRVSWELRAGRNTWPSEPPIETWSGDIVGNQGDSSKSFTFEDPGWFTLTAHVLDAAGFMSNTFAHWKINVLPN
ncbi:MAG: hypothetical protein JRG94_05790 [Deltaproteobacteria bacterium]|nr:hypothetical protein [Deltaproteobacteria bacterium]